MKASWVIRERTLIIKNYAKETVQSRRGWDESRTGNKRAKWLLVITTGLLGRI